MSTIKPHAPVAAPAEIMAMARAAGKAASIPTACPVPDMSQAEWDRLVSRFSISPDGCWLYSVKNGRAGYGVTRVQGKHTYVHRLMYSAMIGPIPDGLVCDHLCRVPNCANPHHIEVVTQSVNVKRGLSPVLAKARVEDRTHCPNGHEFTPDNTLMRKNGWRHCRTCRNLAWADYYKRQGQQGGNLNLDPATVEAILASTESARSLAKKMGINRRLIGLVRSRQVAETRAPRADQLDRAAGLGRAYDALDAHQSQLRCRGVRGNMSEEINVRVAYGDLTPAKLRDLIALRERASSGPWQIETGLMSKDRHITTFMRERGRPSEESDGPIAYVSGERTVSRERYGETSYSKREIKSAQDDADLIVAAVNAVQPLCEAILRGDQLDETAWLIEWPANKHAPLRYFGGGAEPPVMSANDAVRFCRKRDAEAIVRDLKLAGCSVAEHRWVNVRPATEGEA